MRHSLAFPLLILAALLVATPARARRVPTSVTPPMDALLREGLDALYRMDFPAADAAMAKAMALDPAYPHPYLGVAALDLVRYSYAAKESDSALFKGFQADIAKAVSVSETWLKTHPNDPDALMVLGAAHGISGRMAITRHEWLDGFRHGRAAMKSIRLSLKLDPELYDATLGVGMFDYYVDTIPRFAGWLAKIMLGGSRERGLKELHLAAEKGDYGKTAAKLILVEISIEDAFGARNPAEALRLITEVFHRYPDSAMFHSAYAVVLYENGKVDDALRESREYLARTASGRYPSGFHAKGRALIGTMLWARGDLEGALAEFRAGAGETGSLKNWNVLCRARAGQVLDALGRRPEALEAYRAAAAGGDKNSWDYQAWIKPCLSKPCVGSKFPGRFAP
jgi:tetratricopeptide (TPR) repeat protein